jgi:hypothetical protein
VVAPATPDPAALTARIKELEGLVAKEQAIKQKAIAQRDAAKKNPEVDAEVIKFQKAQLDELTGRFSKMAEKTKTAAISVAASSKLAAMGVNPGLLAIAIKSLDHNLVQYDEDTDGVDDTALGAAVAKLKSQHPALFEKTVTTPKYRAPADVANAAGNDNGISRDEWRSMSSLDQMKAVKAGRKPNY